MGVMTAHTDPNALKHEPLDGAAPHHSDPTGSASEPDADAIKMFVGQVPRHWNELDCRKLFEEYGPVFSCSILRDKQTQQSKGCCFVTFYHRKDAIEAQGSLHNVKTLDGMHHPVQMKPADTENRNERKLFIGQLSKKYNEEDLKKMFARFGHVEDCSILKDNDNKSKGCAFVTFVNRSAAVSAAKEMHHSQTMEGCSGPIVVKFADTQKDKDAKQKAATLSVTDMLGAAGRSSPLALNAALLQQLGGGGNATQNALLGLLSGGQQQTQQQNVFALLGSVLSAIGKLTENTNNNQSPSGGSNGQTSVSAMPPSSSGSPPHQQQTQDLGMLGQSLLGPNPALDQIQQLQQAQLLAVQNNMYMQNFNQAQIPQQNKPVEAKRLEQWGDYGYLNESPPTEPSPTSSMDLKQQQQQQQQQQQAALLQQQTLAYNQLQSLQQPQIPYDLLLGAQLGLGGGLAGMKAASPVGAATLALNPAANYQAIALQQQMALLQNLQASQAPQIQQTAVVGNGDTKGPEGANLFIYHLPQDFDDSHLLSTFAPFGKVLSAKVFIDKFTNLSKCFGFVSFDNAASAANAIQSMNGFQIGTKRLKVQLKVQRNTPYTRP